MLALPLVSVDLSSDRVSAMENRMLANRPSVADIKDRPGIFVRQFDEWFKDSTGFRERLLVLYKAVNENKWLNNVVQYTDGLYVYLIGEKGHHYFADTDGWMISKFQGKEFLSGEQLSGMAAKLEEVKTYLDNKDIPLIVMFCIDKETIYPEFYPKSIKRGPEPVQLDVITEYLKQNTSVDVFNIRQALLAEKDTNLLYVVSSGDLTHYTQIGAFFAYRELMKHINVYFPQIIPYELDVIDISYSKNGVPNVKLKSGFAYQKLDASFFDDVDPVLLSTGRIRGYENINSDLPIILFFHDSYASENFIGKYFAQKFGKAIFIHFSHINHIDDYISQFKPDIVIFESAERQIDGFANCVVGIPELP
jgi:hypothetical protein